MKSAAERLIDDAQQGEMTLILGAGISVTRGIPLWVPLVQKFGEQVFAGAPPWGNKEALTAIPLGLQMALETIEQKLVSRGPKRFTDALRSVTYEAATLTPNPTAGDTIAVLAEVIRQDQRRPNRRIRRIISFNVDDLLEHEVHAGLESPRRAPIVWPIVRESHHPRRSSGFGSRPPIPLYHVHGFIPRAPAIEPSDSDEIKAHKSKANPFSAEDQLVFTDAQYWASVSSPMAFPNRVLLNALHDSHCVFIGLSMTDINLTRWLGHHFNEVMADKQSQFSKDDRSAGPDAEKSKLRPSEIRRRAKRALDRHYWLQVRPNPLLAKIMERRGVRLVELPTWGAPLTNLIEQAFGD